MSSIINIDDEYGQGLPGMPDAFPPVVETLGEDGEPIFGFEGEMPMGPEEEGRPFDFHENLAEFAESPNLANLSSMLLKEIKTDSDSRSEWDNTIEIGLKYLGLKLEEFRSEPFINACAAFDSTLMTALVRSYATAQAELFPPNGPAAGKIIGPVSEEAETKAEEKKTFYNYYLTEDDKPYYENSQCLLMNALFFGTAFRKIYQDPILNKPIARMVRPHDLLVDPNATSILEASRITQIMRMSRRDIKILQAKGTYRRIELPDISELHELEDNVIDKTIDMIDGISKSESDNRSTFQMYECYVDLSIDDAELIDDNIDNPDGIPMPYIITLCDTDRNIYAARRNWKEGDPTFARKRYFERYYPLPGFGIYGIGLIQLIGNAAIVNTSLLRQSVDKGSLSNFPGLLKTEDLSATDNNIAVGPGDVKTINTGGKPIGDCIMPMPYSEPSAALIGLRREMKEDAMILASTGEQKIAENNSNAPVGTTLALLEVESRMSSAILRNLRQSLTNELEMLDALFQENLSEPFQFSVEGKQSQITQEHFDGSVKIVPVSDPAMMTSTQRIMRAAARIEAAEKAPQFYDLRELHRQYQTAIGTTDLDKIMPPPQEAQPLDPISENVNAMLGKPLRAAPWQEHAAHLMVHGAELNNPQISDLARQSLGAHIQEHVSQQYLVQMQMAMGIEMPPLEQLQDPQMQNQLALMAAQAAEQQMAQQQMAAQAQQPVDPNTLLALDIAQKKEQAELNYAAKMAEFELRKEEMERTQETEAFKTQMRFESDMKKLEVQEEMADDKNEVELEKIHLQQRGKDNARK
jgi:hypothetical protein